MDTYHGNNTSIVLETLDHVQFVLGFGFRRQDGNLKFKGNSLSRMRHISGKLFNHQQS